MVYDFRTKPNSVTVWMVRFPDAPGGAEEFEMEFDDLEIAIKMYRDWYSEYTKIFEENEC